MRFFFHFFLPMLFIFLIRISKILLESGSRCLQITEKVAFNIASEASYVYILDKSLLKMPEMVSMTEACGHTVLPDMSLLIGQNLLKNAKFKFYILSGQKFIKNAKIGQFSEFLKWDIWVIFKHCAIYYRSPIALS